MDVSRSSLEIVASVPEEKHIHYYELCLCICFYEGLFSGRYQRTHSKKL